MAASRLARREPPKRANAVLQRLARESTIPCALCLALARLRGLWDRKIRWNGVLEGANRRIVRGRGLMYAVIQTGGKQYRVAEGDRLKVEKMVAETGASIELDQVLLVADGADVKVGKPYLDGGKVTATVESHGRGKKVKIIKFRRRKQHLKRQGHRQWFTELKVTGIDAGWGGGRYGPQEGRRQLPQRSRFPVQAPWRQDLRRPGGSGGEYHRPSAAPVSQWQECRLR